MSASSGPLARLFKQPLACMGLFFVIGVWAAYTFSRYAWYIVLAGAIVAVLFLFLRPMRALRFVAAFCALAFALSAALMAHGLTEAKSAKPAVGQLEGVVRSVAVEGQTYSRFVLGRCTVDGKPLGGDVLVYSYDMSEANYGDTVRVTDADVLLPEAAANPGQAPPFKTAWSKGASLVCYAEQVRILKYGDGVVPYVLSVRESMLGALEGSMDGESYALIKGMLFGDTSGMEEEWVNSYRASGIVHLLAVSGLHVSIVAASLLWLLGRLKLKKSLPFIMAAVLGAYCVMAAFSPSVIRASIMVMLGAVARAVGEEYSGLNALGFSTAVMLAARPFYLLSVGFCLSVCATLGILVLYYPFSRCFQGRPIGKSKPFMAVWRAACITFSAQLGVLPLQLMNFYTLPTLSVVTNVLVSPLVSLAAVCGFACALMGCVWPPLGAIPAFVASLCSKGISLISDQAVEWGLTALVTGCPNYWELTALSLLILMLFVWRSKRLRLALMTLSLVLVLLRLPAARPIEDDRLEVVFLDVGQGDCAYISRGQRHMLIDGGNANGYYDSGNRVILPFLQYMGVTRLDNVVVTHPDQDHFGGLLAVLEEMDVTRVLVSTPFGDQSYQELITLARKTSVVRTLSAGGTITLGDAELDVLWPHDKSQTPPDKVDTNAQSLVLLLKYSRTYVLFMGDLEKEMALELKLPRAQVIKLSHHGSGDGSNRALIDRVRPDYAIISVGKNNYGHPGPNVLTALDQAGVEVYRTDQNGAVQLVVTPQRATIAPMKRPEQTGEEQGKNVPLPLIPANRIN